MQTFIVVFLGLAVIGLGILWAVLAYKIRKNAQPIVLPASEKLSTFRDAYSRLGADLNDAALLAVHSNLLPRFENPYVAAMDEWVTTLRRLAKRGAESYSLPVSGTPRPQDAASPKPDPADDEKALGLVAICEFVLEGHVPREVGRQYFDQLVEIHGAVLAQEGRGKESVASFDSLLEKQRARAQLR